MIDPADIFRAAERAFEAAERRSDSEVRYQVAGRVLALRFGGSGLAAKLLPALAHLERVQNVPADLVICSWDDVSSEVSLTEFMPGMDRHGLKYAEGSVRLAWESGSRSLQAYDPMRGLALFWIPSIKELAVWEQGAPFRRIFHWWSAALGLQLVHGAAVGTKSGGVLLAGRGGSGKSTMALACVGSSLSYVADDYCLLQPGEPTRVHSIYGSGKADSAAIARLPSLADAFRASPIDQQGKSIIFIAEHVRQAILHTFPLRAVVVPKIVPGVECHAEVLPRGEALRALAPSTLFQMPGDRANSLSRMSALIRELPCFRLHIGNDPAAARPFLEDISAGSGLPL